MTNTKETSTKKKSTTSSKTSTTAKKTSTTRKTTPTKKTTTKTTVKKVAEAPKIKKVQITEIKKTEKQQEVKLREQETNTFLIVLGIIVLAIVAVLIFSLTYAYFSATVKETNPNNTDVQIMTADLLVTYMDGDSNIELDSKIEPDDTFYKEFSVRNDGNDLANYTIVLEKLENTFEKDAIYENDKVTCPIEPSNDELTFTLSRLDKKQGEEIAKISTGTLPCVTPAMAEDNPFIIYTSDSVEVGTTNYYRLTIKYNNLSVDQSNNMDYGKLSSKINIIATDEQYTNEFKPTKKITTQAN